MGRDVDIYNGFDEYTTNSSVEDMLDIDFPVDYDKLEEFDDVYTDESIDSY